MSYIDKSRVVLKNGLIAVIRTAVPKDAPGIIALMKSVVKEKIYLLNDADEYKETIKTKIKSIRKFRKQNGKLMMVALINNTIAGYATFENFDFRKAMHAGYLSIYIIRKFRSIGLGKVLMKELIKWGKKNKIIRKLCLVTFSSNKRAIGLNIKTGFKIEGICRGDVKINGKYYDNILMYKFVNK